MKANIATTKEQSARLLCCGVSADTADMYINNYNELWASAYKDNQRKDEKGFAPAWSLGALLGLLPKEIYDANANSYYFSLAQEFISTADYRASYKYCLDCDCDFVARWSSQPIEACVQLIEWLTENNYKLNEQ